MIVKVKITRAAVADKDKSGNPLVDKNGKQYRKMGIQTDKYGEQWLSCFLNFKDMKEEKLKAGDEVEITVTEKGDFKNFKLTTGTDRIVAKVSDHESRLARLEQVVFMSADKDVEKPPKATELTADDIPFD